MHTTERVRNLMTTDVTTISSDAEIHELEKLLIQRRVHGVPVLDSSERIVGVVSQTDLLSWHFETGVDGASFSEPPGGRAADPGNGRRLPLSNIRTGLVREIMSPVVHVIGPDKTIAEAAARLIRERVHRLVVVDGGFHVIGILSALDVLRAVPGVRATLAPQTTPTR